MLNQYIVTFLLVVYFSLNVKADVYGDDPLVVPSASSSPSGLHVLRVVPSPDGGSSLHGYSLGAEDQAYKLEFRLKIGWLPREALISDDGQSVILLDTMAVLGSEFKSVITVIDRAGAVQKEWKLESFYDPEHLKKLKWTARVDRLWRLGAFWLTKDHIYFPRNPYEADRIQVPLKDYILDLSKSEVFAVP